MQYHLRDPLRGRQRFYVWRIQAMKTLAVLTALIFVCAIGLAALDTGIGSMTAKLLQGIWNAVNLLSTLGDFTPFNSAQKRYMIVMVVIAVLIGGVAITNLTGLLSSEDVVIYRENRLMIKALAHLTNHVVVVGFDAVGQLVAERLRAAGDTVVVVTSVDTLATLAASRKFYTVSGHAGTDDTVLAAAKIDKARALVVATTDPNSNLVVTLTAHAANPNIVIAVYGDSSARKPLLERAGASIVVTADDLIATALVGQLPGSPAA
jgi:voltage-gated potassium channel Kch